MKRKTRTAPKPVIPKGYYDPADYIMVHKAHYADLLYRATTRIEIAPFKVSVDGVLTENTSTGE
jgi:hypothetical protein